MMNTQAESLCSKKLSTNPWWRTEMSWKTQYKTKHNTTRNIPASRGEKGILKYWCKYSQKENVFPGKTSMFRNDLINKHKNIKDTCWIRPMAYPK